MTAQAQTLNDDFFFESASGPSAVMEQAGKILDSCAQLPVGVNLLISDGALAVSITSVTADRILHLVGTEKIHLAQGVVDFIRYLGAEVRPDDYFLLTIMEEVEKLPAFAAVAEDQFAAFEDYQNKGCHFTDLPRESDAAHETFLGLSQQLNISLEYLLGNLGKVIRLFQILGVRARTMNLSTLFHNFRSGFLEVDLAKSRSLDSATLMSTAESLDASGVTVCMFDKGKFNKKLTDSSASDLDLAVEETEESYAVADGEYRRFIDACLSAEQERMEKAPQLSVRGLMACFKFTLAERELVALPAVVREDDPLRWHETELGQALVCLRDNLNWLAVSIGIKAAGDLETQQKNARIKKSIGELRDLAGGYYIAVSSGREGRQSEQRISELSAAEIVFDLYCLAVLEKRSLQEVIDTAIDILKLIRELENYEPIVGLNSLIAARFSGESYATLLGTQGLILRNTPIVSALEELRSVSDKAKLVVQCADGREVPITKIPLDEFRRAIIIMGRRMQVPHSPERILGVIKDRVVPEIRSLPKAVIAQRPHDLTRIVELALAGIPARYPLRRPWKKIDLDQMISLGSCLEPGMRNCLGCPVNSLYGLVMKTALARGFNELITYEATGCFEVYSGIWPYTGKAFPSVHGVFGGVPSEMLGGYAAKRARARYTKEHGGAPANQVLHLGWAGDGATFDIGFGNLSGLFSRLQRLSRDELEDDLHQRALYVCYDNEGYQNTGNQYSAATAPGGNTTTNPRGVNKPIGNDMRKKPIVEIVAEHGVPLSARMNIHRQEHITRVVARALEDGDRGSFLHFLQPCTTGWKFTADSLTYDLAYLSEEGGLFSPVTIEHGVPYLEIYPTARNPGDSFLKLQARFKHLLGAGADSKENLERVINYYRDEWDRNLRLTGYDGEIPQADRFKYLEEEHRMPRVS